MTTDVTSVLRSFWLFVCLCLIFNSVLPSRVFAQDTLTTSGDTAQAIPDTLLFKIQKAQAAITSINAANKKGYNLPALQRVLSEIQADIAPLRKDFAAMKAQIDAKNLVSYSLIIKDAQEKLTSLRTALMKHNGNLQRMSDQVLSLSSDSLLNIQAGDEAEKRLYSKQLEDIRLRLQGAGRLNGLNLDKVSRLLAEVSAEGILLNDLQAQTNEMLAHSGELAMGKETPYLWDAPLKEYEGKSTDQLLSLAFNGQLQILKYFIKASWDMCMLSLLIAAAFFFWLRGNYKRSRRVLIRRQIGILNFPHLKPFPFLAAAIVWLCLLPLLLPDAPAVFVELSVLLLAVSVSVQIRKNLSDHAFGLWMSAIILYAGLIIGSNIVFDALPMRLFLLGLNAAFLYGAKLLLKDLRRFQFSGRFFRLVVSLFFGLNGLAIILNVLGRISIAKALTSTGTVGLLLVLGLSVFIQIILDALEIQIRISSCTKGLFSRLSHSRVRAFARRTLSLLGILIWFLVFLINLNLSSWLGTVLNEVLSKPRMFGSIHFTLGNLVFFTAIVYVANLLQKHVPLLFGEGGQTFDEEVAHKSSAVALIRLVVIVIGLLLAVSASGLPMDKLTVILGALSVGIGLGMQNIVNNFVSGIILIFEKPFRIGDFVELADKKGKVKDIGIRSSKLLTAQGSEIIIPNGDLLSGRLVNWTLSHDYVKSELSFKVSSDADLDLVIKAITEEVRETENMMKNLEPEVLISSISGDAVELKILVWVSSIYVEPESKSMLMKRLLQRMRSMQVKVM